MNDKSFISRWSRLKSEQAVQEQRSEETHDKPEKGSLTTDDITVELPISGSSASDLIESSSAFPEALPEEQLSEQDKLNRETDQALTEIPPLTDEDMPPVESLNEDSDFSQFLSSSVSDELRNLALRKLFNLPQFNARDGLNDYDDDFSKIPVLAQEVAAKMRSWIHDQQDQLTSEIKEELQEALQTESNKDQKAETIGELIEKPAETLTEKANINTPEVSDITEQLSDTDDGLGDADLHG